MSSPLRPYVAALSLAGVAALGFAGPAQAQEFQACEVAGAPGSGAYPPATVQDAAVSDGTPERGQTITVTSGCAEFAPGATVTVALGSTIVGTTLASAAGEAVLSFAVPTTLPDGAAEVLFSGLGFDGQPNQVGVPVQIAGGAGGPATGDDDVQDVVDDDGAGTVSVGGVQLPRTGSAEVLPLTAAGIGLVAAGAALVVVARRRRQDQLPTA